MSKTTTNPTPQETARMAVELAQKKGAREASASANRRREVEITWRDGKLERISEATTRGLSLALYVDGRYSAVSTSDLRPAALSHFIDDAVRLTRALAKDPFRALPDPALYEGQADIDLRIEDPKYAEVTPQQRRALAKAMEEAARAQKGKAQILSVTSGVTDVQSELFRVASNGFSGQHRDTTFFLTTDVSVKDPDGRRPEDYALARGCFFGELPAAQKVGTEAARRAYNRVGAKKIPSAVLPLVVDNRAAGRLAGFLSAPLSGQSLQQRRSCFEGKLGQKIGSARFTVTDDPHVVKGLNSRLFDSEGIAARKLPIFEAGVLRSYYIDNYYGRKLKMAPTTGRSSNLSWGLGDKGQAALIADIKDGVFLTSFIGGNSNGTTGDFSLGIQGFRIRNGQIAEPVSEMNISGNHLELWQHLLATGNDPYPYHPSRTPTLVFDKVQFAGT